MIIESSSPCKWLNGKLVVGASLNSDLKAACCGWSFSSKLGPWPHAPCMHVAGRMEWAVVCDYSTIVMLVEISRYGPDVKRRLI